MLKADDKEQSESNKRADIENLRRRASSMEALYTSYEPVHRDIAAYIEPRSYSETVDTVTEDGGRKDSKIINITPRLAARTLASGMQSGITSPLRPWFRLALPDPDMNKFEPYRFWLSDVEVVLRNILARSNIYDKLKSCYGNLGLYGTGMLWVEEDDEDYIRGHNLTTGTYWIDTNHRGAVDSVYRKPRMTVKQVVERFGDRASSYHRTEYDRGNYSAIVPVRHYVGPSGSRTGKKYMSVWWDESRGEILRTSGYEHRPFMGPRWDVYAENSWGFGPGEISLGDNRQLQHMEKRKLQGIDRNVDPPLQADASLRGQRKSSLPGGHELCERPYQRHGAGLPAPL